MPASRDLDFAAARLAGGSALLTNRQGRLTREQRRTIRRFRRGRMGQALLRTVLLGGTVTIVGRAESPQLRDVRLVLLVVMGLFLLNTVGRAYVLWHVVEGDLAAGQVREMEGQFLRLSGDRITFRVWDQRTRLTLAAAPDVPLQRGTVYRIYLLPRSGVLLGVEARYDRA